MLFLGPRESSPGVGRLVRSGAACFLCGFCCLPVGFQGHGDVVGLVFAERWVAGGVGLPGGEGLCHGVADHEATGLTVWRSMKSARASSLIR